MFKKCLPVVLALVLAGCGGAPPNTPQSSVTSAGTTSESAVSSESIGDYTFSVPSTWTKEGDYFYIHNAYTEPDKLYWDYTLYYFDSAGGILYHFHSNI